MEAAHIRQGHPKGVADSFFDLDHVIYLKLMLVAITGDIPTCKGRRLDLDIFLLIGYSIEWVPN